MKKKLMALVMAGMMSVAVLAGCGDKAEAPAADTEAAASGELTFADLQKNYALLQDAYQQVEDLYMNDGIAQDDNIESLLAQAKEVMDEMGEITEDQLPSQADMQSINDSMASLADSLGKIVDSMEVVDNSGEEATTEVEAAEVEEEAAVSYTYDAGFYVSDGSSDAVICMFVGDDGSQVAYLSDGSEELFAEYEVGEAELEDGTPYVLVQIGDVVLGYLTDGEDWYIVNEDGEIAAATELSAQEAEAILEAVAE